MSIAESFLLSPGRMGLACLNGGLFAVGVWAVCRLVPRLPAALRAWLWWIACAKLLLDMCGVAPLALPVLPAAPARSLVQAAPSPRLFPQIHPALAGQTAPPLAISVPASPTAPSPAAHALPSLSGTLCLQALWLVGVGLSLGLAARQGLRVRQWRHAAAPATLPPGLAQSLASALGLRRPPLVRESAAISAPCVTGLWSPAILLPAQFAASLSPTEQRLALAHEMAHIRRGDLWLALLPTLTQTVFFFHPLAWLAVREWTAAREEACDALALAVTGAAPAQMGHLLLKMAGRGTQTPALGLSPGYHALKRRLGGLISRPLPARRVWALLALALPGLLPWRLTAATSHASARPADAVPDRYTVSDLGNVTEAAALNAAGQVALTWRDGNESQGLTGHAAALTLVGALPKHHFSVAYGINTSGQVAAASYNIPGHGRAFLWDGVSPRRLGSLPGYPYSEARAVSDSGQVAGFATTGARDRWKALVARAFVWHSGEMTDLGTLGGPYSAAYGLNNAGQVVGKSDTDTFGATHAFLWQNGQMQDLGTLGGANSLACQVSDSGLVVGSAETGTGDIRHAFAWQNGTMRDLGTLTGCSASTASAVNASGQIVGDAAPSASSADKRAVLWHGGQALDLNALLPSGSGWVLCQARAINDRGQIAGNGLWNGRPRAFLLTPR